MVVGSEERTARSSRPRIGRSRLIVGALALVAVTGPWIAMQIQTACEAAARQAVLGYTEALNSGEALLALEAFASAENFSWFSESSRRIGDAARDRDSLGDYLSDRVAQDARVRILFFDFNGEPPVGVLGHFGFHALNESWELISAKGAVSCETGNVTVLSFGGA
jgi:hypothetical protein